MRIEDSIKLDYCDVLLRPKRSTLASRNDVSLTRTFRFRNSGESWTGVPILAANMDNIGTVAVATELSKHGMITCMFKDLPYEDDHIFTHHKNNVAVTFGMDTKSQEKAEHILNTYEPKFICIDVANGYTESFVDLIKETRDKWSNKIIIAGNVVTAEMTEELILAGADCIKVGIGPGSVCTTRKMTGVGYPQLSAVMECSDAAHGLGGHIVADGGCVCPGDVAKAFAGGADFVMLGGMFAGHDESGGELVYEESVSSKDPRIVSKRFYGMSSEEAMNKHSGGVALYRAAEGKSVDVPYRGKIENTLYEIMGGLRSCCTYIGAKNIKDIPRCATFIRVNRQLNNMFT